MRQNDHRKKSRGGIIAWSMNPGAWGLVGVVELSLLSGYARTPTGPSRGWPAEGWGCSVDVREVFLMPVFAGTPTLQSDGKGPLWTSTKARGEDREPCVGTVMVTTRLQPTHDYRRAGEGMDAVGDAGDGELCVGRGDGRMTLSGRPRALTAVCDTDFTAPRTVFLLHLSILASTWTVVLLASCHIAHTISLAIDNVSYVDAPRMADGTLPSHFLSRPLRRLRVLRRAARRRQDVVGLPSLLLVGLASGVTSSRVMGRMLWEAHA